MLPTNDEIQQLDHINLTPDTDIQDPHDVTFSKQEICMVDYKGVVKENLPDNHQ
eukprot:CAMPEP_0194161554 /NCGR_PEP_ID=MMETSP0152-20130528/79007_1 /TAXON_ID=1049557 /ORGANISM="Thalassiothrix antarctica, Strain L6-D1" /LENGTH=53 /DNA_ID=CAMNT_0038871355 /DNA_START=269 /DNA_END=430 /DNA_ORIENTATION=-